MSDVLIAAVLVAISYLIGGVPAAYLGGRLQRGVDIREHGNGNVGTVNAVRMLGMRSGLLILGADAAKGALVIAIGRFAGASDYTLFAMAIAVTAGHNWSPYIGFKGGKGVAVIFGISLAMAPVLSTLAGPVVFAIYFATRSWVWAFGAGIIAINAIFIGTGAPALCIILCLVLSFLVITTHFAREFTELKQALRDRNWRKVGLLE
ncbi:MAG: glycerol-3-phosphate acyltransferase [Chloroflexi bacterium]|nr:glycerol-3-phosphate acyltransferase [Chloroflexota bacterium]MBT4944241.1 glycerol-3-phosphate acyltransferase [Chloroflexota bacterium]MBT5253863.1 glycerol-3-phosphate acyltransferase [Chloroflexota bacterium]MBT5892230.1 glycerol-3-phosphate acyltransferase [Chloroflexota bacterium]MBT6707150.1 glycerol-3-phosphate acyltransferase [Chloroflexota bacterium]